jgi:soluble lytic murein transglycosylase
MLFWEFRAGRIIVFSFWSLCLVLSSCRLFASPSRSGLFSRSSLHQPSNKSEIKAFEKETFVLAKSFEREGKYEEANQLYMGLIDAEPSWQLLLSYFIANNYLKKGDCRNATRWYRRVLLDSTREEFKNHESGILVDATLYRLSSIAVQDDYSLKVLRRLSRILPIANFYLCLTYQLRGDIFEASACYSKLLNDGESPYRKLALQEIVKDMRIVSELLKGGTSLESLIGMYIDCRLYNEAVIISYQGVESEKVLEQRAFCFFNLGDYPSAIKLYSDLFKYSKSSGALLQMAYSYYHSGQYELAAKHLQQYFDRTLRDESPEVEKHPSPDAAFLLLQLQKRDAKPLDYLSAVRNFLQLYNVYGKNEYLIYRTFYHLLNSGEDENAIRFLLEHYPMINSYFYRGWAAYVLGLYHDPHYFRDAMYTRPGSYYYFKVIEGYGNSLNLEKVETKYNNLRLFYDLDAPSPLLKIGLEGLASGWDLIFSPERISSGKLFRIYELGFPEEVEEIATVSLPVAGLEQQIILRYLLSRISYDRGDYYMGITHAEEMVRELGERYRVLLPEDVLNLLYPRAFLDIVKSSRQFIGSGIDERFILALIREESRFNQRARSAKGAIGLMQILPETASWVLKKKISIDELMDPAVNIDTGMNYFMYLLSIFKSTEMALAAYNGGPARVKRWLSKRSCDSIEKFVEEFPYEETRNFIKKVIASYMIYKELYRLPEEPLRAGN